MYKQCNNNNNSNNFPYNNITTINTPPDNYDSNTIGNVSIEQLQQKRDNDIK